MHLSFRHNSQNKNIRVGISILNVVKYILTLLQMNLE